MHILCHMSIQWPREPSRESDHIVPGSSLSYFVNSNLSLLTQNLISAFFKYKQMTSDLKVHPRSLKPRRTDPWPNEAEPFPCISARKGEWERGVTISWRCFHPPLLTHAKSGIPLSRTQVLAQLEPTGATIQPHRRLGSAVCSRRAGTGDRVLNLPATRKIIWHSFSTRFPCRRIYDEKKRLIFWRSFKVTVPIS